MLPPPCLKAFAVTLSVASFREVFCLAKQALFFITHYIYFFREINMENFQKLEKIGEGTAKDLTHKEILCHRTFSISALS